MKSPYILGTGPARLALLAGTALGSAAPAAAQQVTTSPFNLDIGGYAILGLGYADSEATGEGANAFEAPSPAFPNGRFVNETDGQPVQIINEMEIHFNFELVADNGLTFGYKMELEGDGREADEYVGSVKGGFGTIEIGNEDGAHDRLTNFFAAYEFVSVADGDGVLFDFADSGVIVPDTAGGDTGDGFKITYFTPTIAGFRAGASYAATGDQGGTSNSDTDNSGEGFEVGARYEGEFGDFSIQLGGGYTFFTDDDDDDGWTVGTILGFRGFELSGALAQESDDKTSYALGLSYGTGPWGANLSYAQMLDFDTVEEADDAFGVTGEVTYRLAPGVVTGLGVEYASDTFAVDGDGDIARNPDGSPLAQSSGFAAGLFLGFTF